MLDGRLENEEEEKNVEVQLLGQTPVHDDLVVFIRVVAVAVFAAVVGALAEGAVRPEEGRLALAAHERRAAQRRARTGRGGVRRTVIIAQAATPCPA